MMKQRSNSDAPGNKLMAGGETAGQGVDAGEMGETLKRKNNLVKSFGYAASGVVRREASATSRSMSWRRLWFLPRARFCGCLHGDGLRSRYAWACNSPWKP